MQITVDPDVLKAFCAKFADMLEKKLYQSFFQKSGKDMLQSILGMLH
jgi:hypothetical protein